jgi:cytosine/adenosine deaminase-related metal-dependent hydrolase
LLGPDILLSHSTRLTADEAQQLIKGKAHISATPSTELSMGLGDPVCFRDDLYPISSLGVDCHAFTSADIPGQMRLALQTARGIRNQRIIDTGKTPRKVHFTVEKAFNLGTIQGARAVGMGSEIGSLEEGKLADIVIFDANSPAMVCAAEQDPVAAIVLHSSAHDIETVIVDGIIKKEGGKLVPVEGIEKQVAGGEKDVLGWKDVAAELLKSRERIEKKVQEIDYEKARKSIFQVLMVQEDTLSDDL